MSGDARVLPAALPRSALPGGGEIAERTPRVFGIVGEAPPEFWEPS